jgi:hypothetical protein
MALEARDDLSFLGPHEGHELKLMKTGNKPLANWLQQIAWLRPMRSAE